MTTITENDILAKAEEVQAAAIDAFMRTADLWAMTDEFENFVLEQVATIPLQFVQFAEYDPAEIEPMLTHLDLTLQDLHDPAIGNIDTVKNHVADWEGNSADAFDELFLANFPSVRARHIELAEEIKRLIVAQADILLRSRESIIDIGDRTVEALNALEASESSGGFWNVVLSVVGAVALVAAPFTGPGAPGTAGLALTLLGASTSVASTAISSNATVGGGSPIDVLDSMSKNIDDLRTAVDDEQRILDEAMMTDYLTALGQINRLVLPRPRVADEGAANLPDFRPPGG